MRGVWFSERLVRLVLLVLGLAATGLLAGLVLLLEATAVRPHQRVAACARPTTAH